MSESVFKQSYKKLIDVFRQVPQKTTLYETMFDGPMTGLDEQEAAVSSKNKKQTTMVAERAEPPKSNFYYDLALRQQLYDRLGFVPSVYAIDALVATLNKTSDSPFWKCYALPSVHNATGCSLMVKSNRPVPLYLAHLFRRSLGGRSIEYKDRSRGDMVVNGGIVSKPPGSVQLLDAKMVSENICEVTGVCVNDVDVVRYPLPTDPTPISPLQTAAVGEKNARNRAFVDVLTYVHSFNPAASGEIFKSEADGTAVFRFHNFDPAHAERLQFQADFDTNGYQADPLDQYMLAKETETIDCLLKIHPAGKSVKHKIAYFQKRAVFITAVLVFLVVVLLASGVFAIMKWRAGASGASADTGGSKMPASNRVAIAPKKVYTPPTEELGGGAVAKSMNNLQTLSVMIENIQNKVENL